jgi:chorismate lyase/3-hydroxybenzoate synthase
MITHEARMRPFTVLQTPTTHSGRFSPPLLTARPPRWVTAVMPSAQAVHSHGPVDVVCSGDLALLTTTVRGAAVMDAAALEAAVSAAYATLGTTLRTLNRFAIRLWNYLPDPAFPMGPGLDRYMVFNAGRHHGYQRWDAPAEMQGASLATASAVGIESDDLTVHCLASSVPGRSIENPRQRPAWQYSRRYGPKPPSFARATIARLDSETRLLVAGTASIVGEDSMHIGDLSGQITETFANLNSLIGNATGRDEPSGAALGRLQDLRVYVPRAEDAVTIATALRARCPQASSEIVVARLCRAELLVEIEGIAGL